MTQFYAVLDWHAATPYRKRFTVSLVAYSEPMSTESHYVHTILGSTGGDARLARRIADQLNRDPEARLIAQPHDLQQ